MSKLQALIHVCWMAVVLVVALWVGWLLRFDRAANLYFLDRWTGEVVEPSMGAAPPERWPLRATDAPPPGAFDDLIPHRKNQEGVR